MAPCDGLAFWLSGRPLGLRKGGKKTVVTCRRAAAACWVAESGQGVSGPQETDARAKDQT